MKNKIMMMIGCGVLVLTGCGQTFDQLLAKAQEAFRQNNYTQVIDDVNLALPRWKDKIGLAKKAEAYQLLGKSYQALRKLDQAGEAYKEAIKCFDTFDAAYELGLIHLANGEPEKARESFQIALRVKNDDPRANLGLGDSLFQLNRLEEARVIYKKILHTSPAVEDALKNIELINRKLAFPRPRLYPARKPRPPGAMRLKKDKRR